MKKRIFLEYYSIHNTPIAHSCNQAMIFQRASLWERPPLVPPFFFSNQINNSRNRQFISKNSTFQQVCSHNGRWGIEVIFLEHHCTIVHQYLITKCMNKRCQLNRCFSPAGFVGTPTLALVSLIKLYQFQEEGAPHFSRHVCSSLIPRLSGSLGMRLGLQVVRWCSKEIFLEYYSIHNPSIPLL